MDAFHLSLGHANFGENFFISDPPYSPFPSQIGFLDGKDAHQHHNGYMWLHKMWYAIVSL